MSGVSEFRKRYTFTRERTLWIGIEREQFLTDRAGNIAPLSEVVLRLLTDRERFGPELSACQLEDRVGPCTISELAGALQQNEHVLRKAEVQLGFSRSFEECAADTMPLDIYPDPSGRYERIARSMSHEVLLAACRVIGIHVHVGMPDHESAISVYDRVIRHCDYLCEIGDGSRGRRLAAYKQVASKWRPSPFETVEGHFAASVAEGFENDPRSDWRIIRISKHGTIEFRMFGASNSISQITGWASVCRTLCCEALVKQAIGATFS